MKNLIFVLGLIFCFRAFAVEKFETRCKNGDCFQFGWVTTGDHYLLDTVCKNNDCGGFGWSSLANDSSTYDVTCKAGGCFTSGWKSTQMVSGRQLDDRVTCKSHNCLAYGWNVLTGYDLMGGSVTCHQNNCAIYGGYSIWRGRNSHTTCNQGDCYHQGWTLIID